MSLLARLFALVMLAVFPAIGIQAYGVFALHTEREREVTRQAERLLRSLEREQARLLDGARHVMSVVAEASFLRNGDYGRCQGFLLRLRQRSPENPLLSVLDAQGRVLCSGEPDAVGRAVDPGTLVRPTLDAGRFVVGERTGWPGVAAPVLPVAVPFRGRDGHPAGVVAMSIGLPWLAANLATRPLPPNASLTVADRTGAVLVRLPLLAEGDPLVLPPSYRRVFSETVAGTTELPGLDGIERVVAFSPAPEAADGLFLSVGLDRTAVLADVWRHTRDGIVLTVVGILVAILAAWIGGVLFIRRPVAALTRAAQAWRTGQPSVRAGLTDPTSEIGQLGFAFDALAETLEARDGELVRSERHLRAVLDSLPCSVWVLDRDGVIRQINRAAVDDAGLPEAELVATPFEALGCWGDDDALRDRLSRAVREAVGGRASRFDAPLRTAGDRLRLIELKLVPMTDPGWAVTHVIVSGTDVTRRKRTENALRMAEERFRTALRTSRILVFNQDCDLRYTWVHDAVWGAAPGDLLGRTDREVFADRPDLADRLAALKARVLDSGGSVREELCVVFAGTEHHLDIAVDPLRDPEGCLVGITGAAIDVTERRRHEDAARAAREDAERATVAKTKFLAAASHDLRQPVQSLFLFAAALRDRLNGHPALPLVENLEQATDTLKRLLDGLLDISRLDSGRITPKVEPVRLAEVLGRIALEYGPRAHERGLTLTVRPTGAWVRTDPALLERILRNLLENALRYTPRGRVLVGGRRRGDTVRLEVWDTGIGIPESRLNDIFEEFTQVADAGRAGNRGLGLGLAIVRRLSRLLSHPLSVRSTTGRGSVFALDLPATGPAAVAAPRLRVVSATDSVRGLIVVIDDEPIVLLGLKAMLEGWGYEVLAARSGPQAVGRLRALGRVPRIVLADYQLQAGETGLQALLAIRDALGEPVPGVILTGDTTPERLEEMRLAGHQILHKPVFPSDLHKLMTLAGAA